MSHPHARRPQIAKDLSHHRARVAALSRDRASDDPELVAARRNLGVAKLFVTVQRALDQGPALTLEQRERLVAVVRGEHPTPDTAHDTAAA